MCPQDREDSRRRFVIALEIKPDNIPALDELGVLVRTKPDCYDFEVTYRELEKIYRKRSDSAPFLARVMVANASMMEREGDLDSAEKIYRDAVGLEPGEFSILESLVDLHVNMLRWSHAAEGIMRFLSRDPAPSDELRVRALLRLASIYADCEMDCHEWEGDGWVDSPAK